MFYPHSIRTRIKTSIANQNQHCQESSIRIPLEQGLRQPSTGCGSLASKFYPHSIRTRIKTLYAIGRHLFQCSIRIPLEQGLRQYVVDAHHREVHHRSIRIPLEQGLRLFVYVYETLESCSSIRIPLEQGLRRVSLEVVGCHLHVLSAFH